MLTFRDLSSVPVLLCLLQGLRKPLVGGVTLGWVMGTLTGVSDSLARGIQKVSHAHRTLTCSFCSSGVWLSVAALAARVQWCMKEGFPAFRQPPVPPCPAPHAPSMTVKRVNWQVLPASQQCAEATEVAGPASAWWAVHPCPGYTGGGSGGVRPTTGALPVGGLGASP